MLAASLLNEIIVIMHPAHPAKLCLVVRGECHLPKNIELMDLDNQANLPFHYDLGEVTKRNVSLI